MFRNYLTIAVRNLLKHKLYSAINVFGLAIGLACCILIALFVASELSYDKQWADADRTWRITREFKARDGNPALLLATNAPQAGPLLQAEFAEIEAMGRIMSAEVLVSRGETAVYEPNFAAGDQGILGIFDFNFVAGAPESALAEPFTIIITESIAERYFGNEEPLGQTLTVENQFELEVTGVISDLPQTTHLEVEMLASLPTFEAIYGDRFIENWASNNFHTYIRLPAGYPIEELTAQLPDFYVKHIGENAPEWTEFHPQRVTSIHLHSNLDNELGSNGSIAVVTTFSAVAAFILLIACINFMNLSAARSTQRAKEVGMRKVMGAERRQLIGQFLGESILLCVIATVLAVAFVELLLPVFSTFVELDLHFDYAGDLRIAAALIGLALLVGGLAGSYPAIYLSAFTPASVLRGEVIRGMSGALFRKSLVVIQFAISIALIIATAVVYGQMRYTQQLDLGLSKEQVVTVAGSRTGGLGDSYQTMKDEWLALPGVVGVTASNLIPSWQNTNGMGIVYEGGDPEGRGMPPLWVDYDFFETYEIAIVAGRSFDQQFTADRVVIPTAETPQTTGNYILSELAAKQLGWTPEQAIGKWFEMSTCSDCDHGSARGLVVGVARDIHFSSIREAIKPVFYFVPPEQMFGFPAMSIASVRLSGDNLDQTLAQLDAIWQDFLPEQPIVRSFLDDEFEALYQGERRQGQLFMIFALLAIVIACLGLYGLAAFTTEARTKEIGVRKVMGGSVWEIVKLLTWEFSKLVLLANVLAWPAAWFLMSRWLEGFAYRIDIGLLVFVGAGVVTLLIAWLTVGGLAARAAASRPVLALRYE